MYVGFTDGFELGLLLGGRDGSSLGFSDGEVDGKLLGFRVGCFSVGTGVGRFAVGSGVRIGIKVGADDGDSVMYGIYSLQKLHALGH